MYDIKVSIDSELPMELRARVKTSALLPLVDSLAYSTRRIADLQFLPMHLSTIGSAKQTRLVLFTVAYAKYGKANDPSGESKKKVDAEMKRLSESEEPFKIDTVVADAHQTLIDLAEKEESVKSSLKSLFLSCALNSWITFETTAKDVWVYAVNQRPDQLAARIFADIGKTDEMEGLSNKGVTLKFLIQNNFDLRDCMGNWLSNKYDFSNLRHTHKAYAAIFDENIKLKEIFENNKLKKLELLRHLLAHRAGIIDQEYKRKTNCLESIGQDVSLSHQEAVAYINLAIKSSCDILEFVDSWLIEHPQRIE